MGVLCGDFSERVSIKNGAEKQSGTFAALPKGVSFMCRIGEMGHHLEDGKNTR